MNNIEKLNSIFCDVFAVEVAALTAEFNKNNVKDWDSVHQLNLVTQVEDTFDIMLDIEDILHFTSYNNVIDILPKYEIEL